MRLLLTNGIERITYIGSSVIFLLSTITAFITKSQAMGFGVYNFYDRSTTWKENRVYYYEESLWQETRPNKRPPWERIERPPLPPPGPQPFVDILDIPPPLRTVPQGTTLFDLLKILPPLEDLLARRIAFSVNKPTFNPNIPPRWRRTEDEKPDPYAIFKRQTPFYSRACPEVQEWVQIGRGINLDNAEVQVSQRQWFWRTTCQNRTQECYGFKKRDDGLTSECRETNSWMIAWAQTPTEMDFRWHHIAIPTCCSCAVPKLFSDF